MATQRIQCDDCHHTAFNTQEPQATCPYCGSDAVSVTTTGQALPYAVQRAATPVAIQLTNNGMYLDRAINAAINGTSPIPVEDYDPESLRQFQAAIGDRRAQRGRYGGGRRPMSNAY